DIREQKVTERLEVGLFRALQSCVRERFHFLQLSGLLQQHTREQQIRPRPVWIFLDQHPHLLLGTAAIAQSEEKVAEVESRSDRLGMIRHLRFVRRPSFCKPALTLAQESEVIVSERKLRVLLCDAREELLGLGQLTDS